MNFSKIFPRSFIRCRQATKIFAACIVFSAWAACSQYVIDYFTVAGGGGGTSTNSLYSVSGTVGQTATGRITGGSFSVDQGYWALAAALQTPGSPLLKIDLAPGVIVLSWVAPVNSFSIEQSATFPPSTWSSVTNSAAFNSGTNQVFIPLSADNRFYRLRSN